MSKRSKQSSATRIIEIPLIKCKHCGEPVAATEKSINRILERGPKNAAPFYICDCEPGDLQVYTAWSRRYGYASEN